VNYTESSLVVKIAGEAFHADIGAKDHMHEHAVISRRDAFPGEIASHRVLRDIQKVPGKGKVLLRVQFIVVLIAAGLGENLVFPG
jgi:hypothetical protein